MDGAGTPRAKPRNNTPDPRATGPHQQLSDIAPRELQEELLRRVRTLPGVEVGWSAISVPYARGFHLKPHAAKGPAEAFQRGSEFGHLHPEHDGSLHLTLPPALYNEVLRAGWGEPHQLAVPCWFSGRATRPSWRSSGGWFARRTTGRRRFNTT
jgi:Family of unknown function (DUF5519)